MKNKKKLVSIIAVIYIVIAGIQIIPAYAAPSTGTIIEDTGWIEEKGNWKYISLIGEWTKDEKGNESRWKYKYSNGQYCYGWLEIAGNWYYFDELRGYMAQDTNLLYGDENKMYYFDDTGKLIDKYLAEELNSKKRGFVVDGFSHERGINTDVNIRYVKENGENTVGWLEYQGYWYYFDPCGHMVKRNMRKINGKIYSFDEEGHLEVNLAKEKRMMDETELNHTGPLDGSGFLCLGTSYTITSDSQGICTIIPLVAGYDIYNILFKTVGHITSNGYPHELLIDEKGEQVFGWYNFPKYTWIGPLNSGYFECTKRWRYYDEDGIMVTSTTKTIDGKTYTFDQHGYLI